MHLIPRIAPTDMLKHFKPLSKFNSMCILSPKLVLTCLCYCQCNNEKLLENPYLQMRGILQLSNDLGVQ